ncbi:MAG: phosphoadenosine phosphosulfate reductase [Candidatus Cloacimonas sp. 4484_209]|nr:MAG: phosphoadenosine phosphosulfate reductase [Candidatus Cloacimonas sp. 4484_209]
MPKIYTEKNVLDAAIERYEFVFNEFDNVYFSISGGKDSSVMIQLAAKVARETNKHFSLLFIDLEAQYQATIRHVEELIKDNKDVLDDIYWIALPISLRNAVSVIQPKWICWDRDEKDKWVRPMPESEYVINEQNCPFDWFKKGMEFEEFILYFAEWFNKRKRGITGCGVAIRANESLNRFRTIVSDKKITYKGKRWTTQVKLGNKILKVYNFYPLYDWRTEDIWGCVSKFNLKFNGIYDLMYKNGISIHQQRLCQPYGDDQRNSLDQFRALEPETWERILNRVHGVNFGNIYARTSLLGNIKSEKPKYMSWQQYAVFLLETIGLYAPELRDHYYRKIRTFLSWYEKEKGIKISDIPDEADKKLESEKKVPSWRRIARAIERNDFWMKRLSFGQTKDAIEELRRLKEKYKGFLLREENTTDKHLKKWLKNE